MDIFFEEHRVILKALINFKVDFIMVGGYAVIFHGHTRTTGDLDIWLKPDNVNKYRLIDALAELNFDAESLETISKWDFQSPHIFCIGSPPERTDFMTHISGVNYLETEAKSIVANIENLSLKIIHLNDLITNKKASARLKDLSDVEYLEKILQIQRKI